MPRKLQLTQTQIAEIKASNPALSGLTDEQISLVGAASGMYVPGPVGGAIGFTLSPKGGLSLTGVSAQFPVTFYESQWNRILSEETATKYAEAVATWGKDGLNCLSDKTDTPEVAKQKESRRRELVPEKFAKAEAISAAGVDKRVKAASKEARTIAQGVARSEGEATRPNGPEMA